MSTGLNNNEHDQNLPRKLAPGLIDDSLFAPYKWLLKQALCSESRVLGFLRFLLVAPLAPLVPFDFHLQFQLFGVFHREWPSRVFHSLCIPLTTMMMMAFAAQFEVQVPHLSIAGIQLPTSINGANIFAILASSWYPLVDIRHRLPGFSAFVLAMMLCVADLAQRYHARFRLNDDRIFSPTNPLIWIAILASMQSLSHIAEKFIPPRLSEETRWVPRKIYFLTLWNKGIFRTLITLGIGYLAGTVSEAWASPRLLPVLLLLLLHRVAGVYTEVVKKFLDLVQQSCADNNPALEYIGTGGTVEPFPELEEAEGKEKTPNGDVPGASSHTGECS
jgi:hypothetical protein